MGSGLPHSNLFDCRQKWLNIMRIYSEVIPYWIEEKLFYLQTQRFLAENMMVIIRFSRSNVLPWAKHNYKRLFDPRVCGMDESCHVNTLKPLTNTFLGEKVINCWQKQKKEKNPKDFYNTETLTDINVMIR